MVSVAALLGWLTHARGQTSARAPSPPARPGAAALPTMAPPTRGERILVLAPHPDDEAVACGGLIALAARARAQVGVVFVTNGDAFRVAAEETFREARVPPADYLKLASVRQRECLASLSQLGLGRRQALFLGYPDKGTAAMWVRYWERSHPYTSRYTRANRNAYRNSLRPGAPYSGRALLDDLETAIRRFRPTLLACPHPGDAHSDHWALYCYSMAALYELGMLNRVRVWLYLSHPPTRWWSGRAQWLDPSLPPPSLDGPETHWGWLALDRAAAERKRRAIEEHKTQTRVMRSFLLNFARERELFGQIAGTRLPGPHLGMGRGTSLRGPEVARAVIDTPGDIGKAEPPGADLLGLRVIWNRDWLSVRVELAGPASAGIEYQVELHWLVKGRVGAPRAYVLRPPGRGTAGCEFRTAGKAVEVSIPLPKRVEGLMIAAGTRSGLRALDRTAWAMLVAR